MFSIGFLFIGNKTTRACSHLVKLVGFSSKIVIFCFKEFMGKKYLSSPMVIFHQLFSSSALCQPGSKNQCPRKRLLVVTLWSQHWGKQGWQLPLGFHKSPVFTNCSSSQNSLFFHRLVWSLKAGGPFNGTLFLSARSFDFCVPPKMGARIGCETDDRCSASGNQWTLSAVQKGS